MLECCLIGEHGRGLLNAALDIRAPHGPHAHPTKWREQGVCSFFPPSAGRHPAGQYLNPMADVLFQENCSNFRFCLSYQDSLSKFIGRTLKDCGEDLLVEISEILFNELAFFRLMQDLDKSSNVASAAKKKNKRSEQTTNVRHAVNVSHVFFTW